MLGGKAQPYHFRKGCFLKQCCGQGCARPGNSGSNPGCYGRVRGKLRTSHLILFNLGTNLPTPPSCLHVPLEQLPPALGSRTLSLFSSICHSGFLPLWIRTLSSYPHRSMTSSSFPVQCQNQVRAELLLLRKELPGRSTGRGSEEGEEAGR